MKPRRRFRRCHTVVTNPPSRRHCRCSSFPVRMLSSEGPGLARGDLTKAQRKRRRIAGRRCPFDRPSWPLPGAALASRGRVEPADPGWLSRGRAIVLILVSSPRRRLQALYSSAIRHEVTLGEDFAPQLGPATTSRRRFWQPVSEVPKFDIWPLIVGTLKSPWSRSCARCRWRRRGALRLEYARPACARSEARHRASGGIPSVVVGFFALMCWRAGSRRLRHRHAAQRAGLRDRALLRGHPDGLLVSEDALRAVPRSYGEASPGSARPAQTVLRSSPRGRTRHRGRVALGFGRAIGETMIVLIASGNAALARRNLGRLGAAPSPRRSPPELGEVVFGSPHYTCSSPWARCSS